MGATSNYGWNYPTVNADADAWGTILNDMAEAIDATVKANADAAANASNLASGTVANARLTANLSSLAGLTLAANKVLYATGAGTVAQADFTAFGQGFVACANAAAGRSALSLGTSATVNTGTSGATIPLLNGANLFSGACIFSGSTNLRFDAGDASSHPVAFMNTAASSQYSGRISWGSSAPGTLAEGELYLQHA